MCKSRHRISIHHPTCLGIPPQPSGTRTIFKAIFLDCASFFSLVDSCRQSKPNSNSLLCGAREGSSCLFFEVPSWNQPLRLAAGGFALDSSGRLAQPSPDQSAHPFSSSPDAYRSASTSALARTPTCQRLWRKLRAGEPIPLSRAPCSVNPMADVQRRRKLCLEAGMERKTS